MCEPASDTSDHQRFDEMFIHLTPRGATVPYNVCFDPDGNIWAATKGGLFKFHGKTKKTLWERKNAFPKKMSPFPQVYCHEKKIIYTSAEHDDKTTVFRIFSLQGELLHESFIDGLVIGLTVTKEGEMFITKSVTSGRSSIYRTSFDAPIGWDEVITLEGEAFVSICAIDEETIIAAMVTLPSNPSSKQRLAYVDVLNGKITKSVSSAGKNHGEIFFPRTIHKYKDGILLMDKSGRFIEFNEKGEFGAVVAEIDSFLSNGFCIKDDEALIALSGIVRDAEGQTICDDWLEFIKLDGSSWKKQRLEKAASKK